MPTYIVFFDQQRPPDRALHSKLFAILESSPGYTQLAEHLHIFQHNGTLPEAAGGILNNTVLGSEVVVAEIGHAAWSTYRTGRDSVLQNLFGPNQI